MGEFENSLWNGFEDEKVRVTEAGCYDEGKPTVYHIGTYSGRLAHIIDWERPNAIIAHSMGGLVLLDALRKLVAGGIPWKGKIVFIETPFNGAPSWKLKYTGFPVDTNAVKDMFVDSDFMKQLDFSVLNECQVLCIIGSFSNRGFGIVGWLAKPVMDPCKRVPKPCINKFDGIEHKALLKHQPAGDMIKSFFTNGYDIL